MHTAPRAAAWVAWAVWTCNSNRRGRRAVVAGFSQERAGFGPLFFFGVRPAGRALRSCLRGSLGTWGVASGAGSPPRWRRHYTEQHPNKAHKSEEWNNKYTVVGYESIEVPAGKFNAWKIEAEGRWTAELEPTQTVVQGAQSNADGVSMVTQTQKTTDRTVSGRTYKAFWYVPEVKRWVKSVEEYYGSGGVRNERYTGELESFKLAE
jgi:hypothetical protein